VLVGVAAIQASMGTGDYECQPSVIRDTRQPSICLPGADWRSAVALSTESVDHLDFTEGLPRKLPITSANESGSTLREKH
jgi:hypothetical protein